MSDNLYKNDFCGNYEDLSSMSSDDNNKSKVYTIIFIFFSKTGMKKILGRARPKKDRVKLVQVI